MPANETAIAIIDIGSNSVRIRVSKGNKVLTRSRATTQLARDFKDNKLNESSINRTFDGLDRLFDIAKEHSATVFAFATAAVRNAQNKEDFVARFFKRYGVQLEVVSGDTEAKLGVIGALGGNSGQIIDIGGASSEIAVFNGQKITYAHSIKLGAVTLTDLCGRDIERAKVRIFEQLQKIDRPILTDCSTHAIGGTANIIGFIQSKEPVFDRDKTNGQVITISELKNLVGEFYKSTPENIVGVYKIDELRAKVIHSGTLLLFILAEFLGVDKLVLTEDDNLEGYYALKVGGEDI